MRIALLCALTAAQALADEPLPLPETWTTCSPNGAFCARLDPSPGMITVYAATDSETPLWKAVGWARVAALSDDGHLLVLGYEGMNLVPQGHAATMPMLTFFREGQVFGVVTLRDLVSDAVLAANTTVSHHNWGTYLGIAKDGHYAVQTTDGRLIHFDMGTAAPAAD